MQGTLTEISEMILSQDTIAIISHASPDGDTLGSQLALAAAVNQIGIRTILINQDPIPSKYQFLTKWNEIKPYEKGMELPKVIIFVDCAHTKLTGIEDIGEVLADKIVINIDHHMSNGKYGMLNYVSPAGANTQLIFRLIQEMKLEFTPEVATALYLGLSTDTGSFLYDNVSVETHEIGAFLLAKGADTDHIRLNFYETTPLARLELLKHMLNHMEIGAQGKLAWSFITNDFVEQVGAGRGDSDGLINQLKNVEGVEVGILFRTTDTDKVKISFRAKTWFDVNALAQKFDGGGHAKAAGCAQFGDLPEIMERVIKEAEAMLVERG